MKNTQTLLTASLLTTSLVTSLAYAATPAAPPPATPPAGSAPGTRPATPPPAPNAAAEQAKKAEAAAQKLAADRAKLDVDSKTEEARLTPAIHAAAKKLASTKYKTLAAGLGPILKSPHRMPTSPARDQYRHPIETLTTFGLKPNMTVIEYAPGEGWYTEILAPLLAAGGKLMVTMTDPNGPKDQRATFYGERQKRFLDKLPEAFGKVERIVIDGKNPQLGLEGKADMVLLMRALHNLHRNKLLPAFLADVHKALKPGGVIGVEQHRAKEGADPDQSAEKGYLPEAFVISTIEAAGFKLAGKSEANANPKDTKDYPEGVWTLPPTFELKDKDREKYAAIGESDRMTLRFVKVDKK